MPKFKLCLFLPGLPSTSHDSVISYFYSILDLVPVVSYCAKSFLLFFIYSFVSLYSGAAGHISGAPPGHMGE